MSSVKDREKHTSNCKEDTAFIPSGLHGLAEDGGDLGEGRMLELLKTLGLKRTQ